jgi:hypothetical protein
MILMNNLSADQIKLLNWMSDVRDPALNLGDKLQDIITGLPAVVPGTPVNAVNASMDLTLTGVVVDGEKVSIGSDIYEFLADAAQTKTYPGNIAVNIEANTVKATGTLTVDTQPTSGDKMTIGTKVYTFVPVGTDTADGEVSIGADLAGAKLAIVAAINGTDGVNDPHPLVRAAAFVVNACAITALVGGAAGNAIATTETFTAGSNGFAAVTLETGADCSAANAIVALVAEITAHDTVGVGATDEAGDVVKLTADAAGVAGNAITLAKTLANGTFTGGATHLAGGVNGTLGTVEKPMVDASYLYLCVANNTVSGKNWRRIALGAAY